MRRTLCLVLSLVFTLAVSSRAQSPSQAPGAREGAITGRVIADDGQPLARAKIEAYSIGVKTARTQSAVTDAEGNFKLANLAPASYRLRTSIPGYVVERRSSEQDFHRIHRLGEHVTLNLIRGGAITGRVTDVTGEPMIGVRVTPRRIRDLEGNSDSGSYQLPRLTDDRGVYRLFGLEPGVYLVFINSSLDRPRVEVERETAVFHPSSSREGAAEITLQAGGEVAGVDIRRRVERGHTVSGSVTGGADAGVMLIHLADRQTESLAAVQPSGGFEIVGVPDGDYELHAQHRAADGSMAASIPRKVSVRDADISGIELTLAPFGSIAGRVTLEPPPARCADASPASLEEILLQAAPIQAEIENSAIWRLRSRQNWGGGGVEPTGEFNLGNLFAGAHQLRADLPSESWFVRAITRTEAGVANPAGNGISLKSGESLSGIQIRLAEGAASLRGNAVPASETDKLPKRLRVHLIPAEPAAANEVLRYAEVVVAGDGAFKFKHLVPGRYWLLAKPADPAKDRPVAWDATARATLRRDAEAAKNEIELKPCSRVKDRIVRIAH